MEKSGKSGSQNPLVGVCKCKTSIFDSNFSCSLCKHCDFYSVPPKQTTGLTIHCKDFFFFEVVILLQANISFCSTLKFHILFSVLLAIYGSLILPREEKKEKSICDYLSVLTIDLFFILFF